MELPKHSPRRFVRIAQAFVTLVYFPGRAFLNDLHRSSPSVVTPQPTKTFFEGARVDVLCRVWVWVVGSRKLETCLPASDFERAWREPFPQMAMASLTRIINAESAVGDE
jgi:hypothetical protein